MTTHTLPSTELLAPFPRLQRLFSKLATAIKKGDLRGFDQALAEGENEFVKRRIYLTLEHGRNIALRNLLRKVFVAGGFIEAKEGEAPVRRTRIPVDEFAAAMRLSSGQSCDTEEVECLLANMIYKVCQPSFASTAPYYILNAIRLCQPASLVGAGQREPIMYMCRFGKSRQ